MLDTVRVRFCCSWKKEFFDSVPHGWEVHKSTKDVTVHSGVVSKSSVFLHHILSGLRISGDSELTEWFEVSMPRLIYQSNASLISNQHELDKAFEALRSLLSLVCDHDVPWNYSRLDLVWHFDVDCKTFLKAYESVLIPVSRKLPVVYSGESVTWRGSKRSLCMYDKGLQMGNSSGPLRIEYRMRDSETIRSFFPKVDDFKGLFEYYASFISHLQPVSVPAPAGLRDNLPLSEFLSLLQDSNCSLRGGVSAVEYYLSFLSSKHVRALRKEMAARSVHFKTVDFRQMLENQGAIHSTTINDHEILEYKGDALRVVHANDSLIG
jgi:hypothetical protein